MAIRNLEYVVRGNTITLDIYFKNAFDVLTDPDSTPTYIITDPDGTTLATGSGTLVSTGYYRCTYDVESDATVSNYYKISWTAYMNTILVPDNWEFFQVRSGEESTAGPSGITINATNLRLIKSVLAYPIADELLLDDDEIKSYCIYPALLEYFTKFPLREEYTTAVTSDVEATIDFPDDYTFGAVDARVVDKFNTTASSSSSFWELVNYQKHGFASKGDTYGIRGYNPSGLRQANFTQYQAEQSRVKYNQIIRIRVDADNKEISVFSNITGTVQIEWAKYSLDFANVKFQQNMNVIRLCQYYLLKHLADTSSIITDSNLDIAINSDELKTKADELREMVMDQWEQYTDIVLIRT